MKNHSCVRPILLYVFLLAYSSASLRSRKKPETKTGVAQGFFFALLYLMLLPAGALASNISLTPNEKNWITEHPVIRLGVGRAYPPFQYMEKGEIFQGIAADYAKLLEQRLGLKLQPQKNLTWTKILKKTKANEIDAWACVTPTPEREKYMLFSKPYLDFPWVIFTRRDAPLIAGVQDLKDKRAAVVKTLANYPRLLKIPDIKFYFVKSPAEGLFSVSVGKADAYMINLAVGDYLVNKHGLTNLKVASPTGWGNNDLCFASRRDWPMLARILQKGLDSISQHEHDAIVSKWLHADLRLGIPWSRIFLWGFWILAGVLLLFGVMLFWNHRLQKEIRVRQIAENALHKAYAEVDELVRQRTAALRKSQEHLNLALDTVAAFTWEVHVSWDGDTPTFDSLIFSPNAAAIFGKASPMDVQLEHLPLLSDEKVKIRRLLQALLLSEEAAMYHECPVVFADEALVWHAHSAHVDRNKHERPDKIYGISVNIHRRKKIEEELQQHANEQDKLNARLLELDRVKSSIITNVSHELRTPLTSLLGFANLTRKTFNRHFDPLAANNDALRKQARRIEANLTIIENESRRLTRLINDFLDLSKIQSGRMKWNERSVDMAELVKQTAASAKVLFLEKPVIAFEVDVPDTLPHLQADPDRLQQVLHNLLHNAYKFTSHGRVRLSCSRQNYQLVISVQDTGTGIAQDDIKHIFTRFHRVENGSNNDAQGGTGLGLSICKEIVSHYHGKILVRSEPGQGSEFQVILPL